MSNSDISSIEERYKNYLFDRVPDLVISKNHTKRLRKKWEHNVKEILKLEHFIARNNPFPKK